MNRSAHIDFPYARWLAVFLFVRLSLLFVFCYFTGGREVASDVDFHILLINSPLGILTGTADPSVGSYPPLQSLITAPLFYLYSLFSDSFLSFRLLMLTIEFFGFFALLFCCSQFSHSSVPTWLVPSLFIFAPFQIFSSIVFIQDEIIGQWLLLIAAGLLLTSKLESFRTALVFTALAAGILFGKIFLLLPAIWLFLFNWNFRTHPWKQGLLAGSVVVAVYSIVFVAAEAQQNAIPLVEFAPNSEYGVTIWPTLVDAFSNEVLNLKSSSLIASTAALFALFVFCVFKTKFLTKELNPLALLVAPIALFLVFFYQHNSEYPILIAPVCLLLCKNTLECMIVWIVTSLAWVPKILFGLKNVGTNNANTSATRDELLSSLTSVMPFDFAMLHTLSLVIYSGIWAILAIGLVLSLGRSQTHQI